MTSHFAFVIGILVALGVFYSKKVKWFMFIIPFAIVATIVNARTGAVVAVMGIAVQSFFSRKRFVTLFALLFLIPTILYLPILLEQLGAEDATLRWIGTFNDEIDNILTGDTNDSTLGYLLKEMIVLPKDFAGWIVGYGYSLYLIRLTDFGKAHSDIGFVNQIIFGGLVYAIPLWYLVYYVCRRFIRSKEFKLGVFIFLVFLIINFKGSFVLNTPSFGLVLIVYYLVVLQRKYDVTFIKNHRNQGK